MILHSLTVENFRQFHGRQHVEFSTDTHKKVTIIYGSNGAGKTAILNTFTWGLYGKTTPGLNSPELLINELAWDTAKKGEDVTAKVVIEFEDDDKMYALERRATINKSSDGMPLPDVRASEVTLHITDEAGKDEKGAAEGTVNAILPERLRRFVFFDGERDIARLAQEDAYEEVEDAIKTVLGLEVIERGIDDLATAQKSLSKELRDAGTPEDEALAQRVEDLENERMTKAEALAEARRNVAADGTQLAKVNDELENYAAARELQQQRKEFEDLESQAAGRVKKAHRDIAENIDKNGYTAFVGELAKGLIDSYDDKRAKKQIPRGIARQFVEDLLEDERCICGAELVEGTTAQREVEGWVEKAGDSDVEAQWHTINGAAKDLLRRRSDHFGYLEQTNGELADALKDTKHWEEKASEISDRVRQIDDDVLQGLEERRDALIAKRDDDTKRIWELENDRDRVDEALREAEKELDAAKGQSAKVELAKRRVTAAREASRIFERILELRTKQVRKEIDSLLKDVFREICFKPYVPALAEDFHLTLSKADGGKVPWSSGEGQILSLSFVAAIAERARGQYEKTKEAHKRGKGLVSFDGGIFPLVLDAVFGVLDGRYQKEAARALVRLAPQVIVISSKEQGADAIEQELWPHAGKIYVSVVHSTKEDEVPETIRLPSGKEQPYVVVGAAEDVCILEGGS